MFSVFLVVSFNLRSVILSTAELQCLSGSAEEAVILKMLLAQADSEDKFSVNSFQKIKGFG